MVNSYCGGLSDVFSQFVYYGILDKRDAQCFRVESSLDTASYILFAAAVLLALLNTLVGNAVFQYFREKELFARHEELNQHHHHDFNDEADDIACQIQPAPVLFTDKFRWLLHREDPVAQQSQTSVVQNSVDDANFQDLKITSTKSTEFCGEHSFDQEDSDDANNPDDMDG